MAFYDIQKHTELLCEYKITPNQFYFLWILTTKRYEMLYKYLQQSLPQEEQIRVEAESKKIGKPVPSSHSFKAEEIKDLVNRGFIKLLKGSFKDELDMYEVTPKFFKKIFVSTNLAGEELWEIYPPFLYINGNRVSARGADKEKLIDAYAKKIKNNLELHIKVLDIVKANRDSLNMGIDKFVNTEYWLDLMTTPEATNYGTEEFTN